SPAGKGIRRRSSNAIEEDGGSQSVRGLRMDDIGDEDLENYLGSLKRGIERRKSLVSSNEDISGTHESLDGEWEEWMCPECGIFLKARLNRCNRCGTSRL